MLRRGQNIIPFSRSHRKQLPKRHGYPRLRRASAISRFAAVAGLGALRDAGLELDPTAAARTALIFAISNGGVIYTRRFYHEIVVSGAAGSESAAFPRDGLQCPGESSCGHPWNYRRQLHAGR